MSTKPQIELFLENESGTQQVAYPFVESDHVSLSNGMDIDTMIRQDVSMPTVAHEDLSFKAGVGDQDVSSAIVDSSVAEMTIKGKTYQNILPEPSTHVLTNNKEMFKVNEGLDPNVEIVDGVSKSAILSGQTLVNLVQQKNMYLLFGTSGQGKVNRTITTSGAIYETSRDDLNSYITIRTEAHPLIKPNTSYTIFFEVVQNTITKNGVEYKGVTVSGYNDSYYGRAGEKQLYHNGEFSLSKGLKKIVITTPSSVASYDGLGFGFPSFAANETPQGQVFEIQNVMIIEGDYTNVDIPYFEGMASCKMPVLKTTGKNLFDGNMVKGTVMGSTGQVVDNSSDRLRSDYIPVNGNSFTVSCATNKWVGVFAYRKDKTYIGYKSSNGYATYKTNENIGFVVISTEELNDFVNNIQLEEGSTSTPYEPYKSNILSCQLAPLNQSMFEQGTFAESTPPNTQTYEQIKLDPNHLYDTRIRTKGTYKVAQGATYEVQLNDGYGIFVCFCKNGLYSATINRWLDGTRITFTVPNDCDEMFFALRKTDNSAITPSDYSRIGLKIHQEVVLRSLPDGVCDTLNLNTGEYVQRVGEVVLNGSEAWLIDLQRETYIRYKINLPHKTKNQSFTISDKLQTITNDNAITDSVRTANNSNTLWIYKINSTGLDEFKTWLSQNPITVQYQLETESIKTVDLSSSGNWEKVVLDGKGFGGADNGLTNTYRIVLTLPNAMDYRTLNDGGYDNLISGTSSVDTKNIQISGGRLYIRIPKKDLLVASVDGAKEYLRQNPLTVWYQTTTILDSTQVKQPIFFEDGHIQLSSGTGNSLIPTLDYQAKTSNSYVMDLMKTNTKYTMKAKTASGTFTIDGTSYGAGTNGTFTTPTSLTNKLLVMSNKTNEEIMILEGDVTDKTIPYFKGIKSAFEDESKIEVLSTGKNLFDFNIATAHGGVRNKDSFSFNNITNIDNNRVKVDSLPHLIEDKTYTLSCLVTNRHSTSININSGYGINGTTWVLMGSVGVGETKRVSMTFIANSDKYGRRLLLGSTTAGSSYTVSQIQIEESSSVTSYEPYKSNNTKIPLLSQFNLLIKENLEDGALNATGTNIEHADRCRTKDYIKVQPNNKYYFKHDIHQWFTVHGYNENKIWVSQLKDVKGSEGVIDIPSNVEYIKIKMDYSLQKAKETNQIFVLYKYRGLAESLKSLPNGVHDEIVLDRENNKAKIIQRVGKVVLDGSEDWNNIVVNDNHVTFRTRDGYISDAKGAWTGDVQNSICDKLVYNVSDAYYARLESYALHTTKALYMCINSSNLTQNTYNAFKQWLSQNPTTVWYELATPIITEVDLSGYPYIYKDGHIFLNGEITPVAEIKYSINQQHQIEASNQDIIRHQKEIDYLYKLIGEYVRVDYKNTLLSLNLELK